MAMVVSLHEFVGEMQLLTNETHAYINKLSGKIIMISDEDFEMAQEEDVGEISDWQNEVVEEAKMVLSSDDYLEIPGKFDIHEYQIMEKFCLSYSDAAIGGVLLEKIKGLGAFRRFKDTVYRYGIEEEWFKFRENAYKEIAISWLEENGLAYIDDLDVLSS